MTINIFITKERSGKIQRHTCIGVDLAAKKKEKKKSETLYNNERPLLSFFLIFFLSFLFHQENENPWLP